MRMARAFQETRGDQVAHWQAIIKQSPDLVPAHSALAQAYLASGRYPEAEAELKRVIELQPDNVAARFDLGFLYLGEKRLDDAIAAYLNEKEISGDDPDLESALADAYQAKGMTKEAQDARELAQQLRGQGR